MFLLPEDQIVISFPIGTQVVTKVYPFRLNYLPWCLLFLPGASQNRLSDHQSLQRAWFELGQGSLAQADLLQRYEAFNDDYDELYQAHSSCKGLSQRLTDTQNSLVKALRTRATLSEDHKALQQVHLDCVGKEVALSEKLAVVEKEKDDLLDKSKDQEEQIKSDEYKKSLSKPFNQAIAAGLSEAFDELFSKIYPYVEKLVASFRLSLGDLQNMWPEGKGLTMGDGAINE
ncbi:hypothetical protein Tco_0174905 [Tanacetum coccineum]